MDYDEELEDGINTAYRKQEKQSNDYSSELAVLLLFMATSAIFSKIPIGQLSVVVNQRARYQVRQTMDGAEGPWTFSPKGYMESNMVKMALDLLKDEGYNINNLLNPVKDTMDKGSWDIMKNNLDRQGQSMFHESNMQGQLSEYTVYDVRMQWNTCEDNGNCQTDSPVCDDCEGYSQMWFTPNEFPETPHDWCRCNEPEIVIEVVQKFDESLF